MGGSYNTGRPTFNTNIRPSAPGPTSDEAARAAAASAAAAAAAAQQQVADLKARYEEALSKDRQYNALAEQIKSLIGSGGGSAESQQLGAALAALNANRNFGTGDLASALNFQVSDEQILNDINSSRMARLSSAIDAGQGRIAYLTDRITTANALLAGLPPGDARRVSSEAFINDLNKELGTVQKSVLDTQKLISDFKPETMETEGGRKLINDFRESLRLPEERAIREIQQIDPEMMKTAVGLGRRYRQLATEPIPSVTEPRTEEMRQAIEQEALNQLRLGSTLGAEERRGYEQAVRAAQTARGNIFGLGPAVQEAAQIGAAGEQRKLARYGAAQQFLASGQAGTDALQRNVAFREALLQGRLGAASGFLASGPSLYNLGQARTAQQQAAFQGYVQANQPLPGQFTPQTYQVPGYVFANPSEPTQMAGQQGSMFSNLYGTQANYLADTYGAQTRAIASQPSGAAMFGEIAGGLSNLIKI
jgi:hypothetical protein